MRDPSILRESEIYAKVSIERILGVETVFSPEQGKGYPDLLNKLNPKVGYEVTEAEIPGDIIGISISNKTAGLPIEKAALIRDKMERFGKSPRERAYSYDYPDPINDGRLTQLLPYKGKALGTMSSIINSETMIGKAFQDRIEDKLDKLRKGFYSKTNEINLVIVSRHRRRFQDTFDRSISPWVEKALSESDGKSFSKIFVVLTDCLLILDGSSGSKISAIGPSDDELVEISSEVKRLING